MDPYYGALAIHASLDVIANSGSSDDDEGYPQDAIPQTNLPRPTGLRVSHISFDLETMDLSLCNFSGAIGDNLFILRPYSNAAWGHLLCIERSMH